MPWRQFLQAVLNQKELLVPKILIKQSAKNEYICTYYKIDKVKVHIFSESRKFCKISTLLLSVFSVDKSKVEILQNFEAFLEYTNFNKNA